MKKYYTIILIFTIMISCQSSQNSNIKSDKRTIHKNNYSTVHNNRFIDKYTNLNKAISNLELLKTIYSDSLEKKQIRFDSLKRLVYYGPSIIENYELTALSVKHYHDIKELNKAYDDKYTEFISVLDKELRTIEKSRLNIDQENWYEKIGHVYSQSMVNKYKRK